MQSRCWAKKVTSVLHIRFMGMVKQNEDISDTDFL